MSRKLAYQVPQLLELERLRSNVVIGPLQQFIFQDSGPQNVPIGGVSPTTTHTAASIASTPVLGTVGQDLSFTPDEGLIIENLYLFFSSFDASGKLQINSCMVIDSLQRVYDVAAGAQFVPYTFAAIAGDFVGFKVGFGMPPFFVRPWLGGPASANPFSVRFLISITNLDGTAVHGYSRTGRLTYRKVGGLSPLEPNVFEPGEG